MWTRFGENAHIAFHPLLLIWRLLYLRSQSCRQLWLEISLLSYAVVSPLIDNLFTLRYFNSMRCAILPLCLATCLVIADISFGSPTTQDQQKAPIDAHRVPARSFDAFNSHSVSRMVAPGGGNRHIQRKRDVLYPSNYLSTALIQRHNHIMDHLQPHSGGSSLAKRSLAGDLVVMGFKLIWIHADVIVSSTLAYYRTTEYYKEMMILAGGEFRFGPTVQNFIITYGCFRLMFEPMAEAVTGMADVLAQEFPDGFGQFIQGFAEALLALAGFVVFATYEILAAGVTMSVRITMVIVESPRYPEMITTP